jgi:hypothetical protein
MVRQEVTDIHLYYTPNSWHCRVYKFAFQEKDIELASCSDKDPVIALKKAISICKND